MKEFFKKKIDRKRWMKFFIHLIVLTILFALPELLFSYSQPFRNPHMRTYMVYVKAGFIVCIFYIDYYLIIPHTIKKGFKHLWHFFNWNLLLVIISMALLYYIHKVFFLQGPMPPPRPHMPTPSEQILHTTSWLLKDFVMIILTMALSVALRFGEAWDQLEKKQQELLASQKIEELESLKNQLNPHFLFNTLNTIYALIDVSPAQAQDAVHKLSTMLRYVLYENPEKVSFCQEIEFAKSYISLMEMRLGEGIVEADFDESAEAESIMVPPLLFIVLLENAFKYGNTGVKGNKIQVSMRLHDDDSIVCSTINHFTPNLTKSNSGGIGISNLRRRLQLLYGNDASLITEIDGCLFRATMTLYNP